MKRSTVVFLLSLLLLLGCQRTRAEVTPTAPASYQTGVHLQGSFEIPEELLSETRGHTTMRYLLYLPEGYGEDSGRTWPFILFLHGSGDDDYDSTFVMSYGLPEVLHNNDEPEDFPFIVVSPQVFPEAAWWDGATMRTVEALLADIIETYQVDRSRVYLTGLSMGGYGSWYMAAAYPEHFAAMASISGSGFQTRQLPAEAVLCRLEEVPLWGIHGAEDQISDPRAAELYLTSLENECNGEVKITLYPDADHFEAYERAYRDPELYEWFLEHTKVSEE